jgi:Carboxypeptidase regulatory-like domain
MTRLQMILLSGCIFFSGCTHVRRGGDATTGAITGSVVDATQTGVGGVTILVLEGGPFPQTLASATSDRTGAFTFDHVPPGRDLIVRAIKKGSRAAVGARKQGVTVRAGQMTDLGPIQLHAGAD